jgi:hypothetical protein
VSPNFTNELKCAIHDVIEEYVVGGIQCFECWHVYPTEEDILIEHRNLAREVKDEHMDEKAVQRAAELYCPLCLHDW